MTQVSVVATVRNESGSIRLLLESLSRQTRPPDEIVIVDGGSTDGTLDLLQRFAQETPLRLCVLSRPGSNISSGRNAAISVARGALIAVTDAGVRLREDWLEQLLAPFSSDAPPDVVGGFYLADTRTLFELALGAVTLPALAEISPGRFYPSSRCLAFRRAAWEAVGGYPEWLDYCEDLLFDFALADAGYAITFNPQAIVFFRPRATLGAFFRQYYRYARGDGKADFWRYRHAVRYATYLVAGPALLALSITHSPLWLLALASGLLLMLRRALGRVISSLAGLSWWARCRVLAWVPLVQCTGDVAKMLGYPAGIWWRWHHPLPAQWPKRQW